ncbi:hypothetical protein K32_06600 [Kaistia sp. 32K]|nr:hypothetical protein K32_06600 [Kaistia sp. 32K]
MAIDAPASRIVCQAPRRNAGQLSRKNEKSNEYESIPSPALLVGSVRIVVRSRVVRQAAARHRSFRRRDEALRKSADLAEDGGIFPVAEGRGIRALWQSGLASRRRASPVPRGLGRRDPTLPAGRGGIGLPFVRVSISVVLIALPWSNAPSRRQE